MSSSSTLPVVFLHGLLGSCDDWAEVVAALQKSALIDPLVIDLPYHNPRENVPCDDFLQARSWLEGKIDALVGNRPFWLVGYSLGGRLALDYALNVDNPNLVGAVLEGANVGLATDTERQARWQNDVAWAMRFQTEPMELVLEDWYQQPVFAHLTPAQRAELIEKRQHHCGERIAQMLLATSLAKQPYYAEALQHARHIHFVIGERDEKFKQMVNAHRLPHQLIPHAGHNAHRENPVQFAQTLEQIILHTQAKGK